MITSALEAKAIVSVKGNTVQFGTENGLRLWFRASSVNQLRRSGVVNGTVTVDGVSYLTVTDGESTYRYPYSASLYAACMGRIVCWSESKDGKILSAMRTTNEPFHAGTATLTAAKTADGRMAVTNGEAELIFARNTLQLHTLYFYNTATGEVVCETPVLTVSALVTYLNGPLRETYGPHALFGLETDGNHTVIRITPRVYGIYDRDAGGVRLNNAVFPADLSFASVPDGAMVAVLFDRASLNAVLEEMNYPVYSKAKGGQASKKEMPRVQPETPSRERGTGLTVSMPEDKPSVREHLTELKTVADGMKKQPQRSRGKAR